MHIYQLGWAWRHSSDFKIERPAGHFGTQLILVRTTGRIVMNKKEYRVKPNTAFLVESCLPHCIYAYGGEYEDDWIRFNIDQDDIDFINSLNLEFNVPVELSDDSVSKLISAADDIFKSDVSGKKEALSHIMCAILINISNHIKPKGKSKSNFYDSKLQTLRKDIYDKPSEEWGIPEIAARLNISVSHFQRLYKNKFGVSCTNDVFMSRMQYAKKLLITTEYSAKEIAIMCGFNSYEYFSRAFTKFACIAPVQYRNKFKE